MNVSPSLAFPIIGLLLLVALSTIGLSYLVQDHTLKASVDSYERTRVDYIAFIIRSRIAGESDKLSALAQSIAGNAAIVHGFGNYARTADPEPLRRSMSALYPKLHIDIFTAIDPSQSLLYRAHAPTQADDSLNIWGVYEALSGMDMLVTSKGPSGLAIRAIAPVYAEHEIVGAIMLATSFDDHFATMIARETQSEISFATQQGVWASSLPEADRGLPDVATMTRSLVEKKRIYAADPQERYARLYLPLTIIDDTFHIIIRTDTSASLHILQQGERRMTELSIVMLVLVVLIGGGFTTHLVRPLKVLKQRSANLTRELSGHRVRAEDHNEVRALEMAFDQLTETLHQHTCDLKTARQVAEQANEAKSQFLAAMSHELRTPLNGVLGNAELLLKARLSSARQRDCLETIYTSGNDLLLLIEDLLDFSRIEAGNGSLVAAPFDLALTVDEVAKRFAPAARAKDIDLLVHYTEDLPRYVVGDARRIEQILGKLVGNSIKFTHQGHVLLTVSGERQGAQQASLRFRIEDTGIGIPPDQLEHVFAKFTQVDSSTTRRYGGAGLGLAISKQLVEQMGGTIGVESQPGQGSTFRFALTLALSQATRRTAAQVRGLKREPVLIAGCNPTGRRILHEQVSSWGMISDETTSVAEAWSKLRAAREAGTPYGIVLLDVGTPGTEIGLRIKADAQLGATQLVVLGRGEPPLAGKTRPNAGPWTYLQKPVTPGELKQAVVRLCKQPRALAKPLRDGRGVSKLRVLLIAGDHFNRVTWQAMLEELGCRVDAAASARAAMDMLDARHEMVFADVSTSDWDGQPMTMAMRRRGASVRRLPVIAILDPGRPAEHERQLAAGMDDQINQPIRLADLKRMLGRWAGRSMRSPVTADGAHCEG